MDLSPSNAETCLPDNTLGNIIRVQFEFSLGNTWGIPGNICGIPGNHGLRTPREEIAFTAWPKIQSQSQILGTAKAYFVCHIGPIFQISLIYASIGCP